MCVVQTFERQAEATLALTFSNGERIETTKEHPFYVESQGFTPASELGIGTSIVTRAGPSAVLASTELRNRATTVYNFEVENTHTYFVGLSNLWVHNQCAFRGTPLLNGTRVFFSGGKRWILGQGDNNGTWGWNHIFRRHIDLNHPIWGIGAPNGKSHFHPKLANQDIIALLRHTITHGKRSMRFGEEIFEVRVNWKSTGTKSYQATVVRNDPALMDQVRTFHPLGPDNF